jgi:hypothetical protein
LLSLMCGWERHLHVTAYFPSVRNGATALEIRMTVALSYRHLIR